MLEAIKNFLSPKRNKYVPHDEAVIISCFFNPQNSPYRLKAFNHFYDSIKHLNHQIIECIIGETRELNGKTVYRTPAQLPVNKNIKRVYTESLLWHKEALLNKIISELPKKYKYVFWVDADVLFTNKNWLVESVEKLSSSYYDILQPFEYCVHLNKDELKPDFNVDNYRSTVSDPKTRHKQMWRSFCANYVTTSHADSFNYDRHGHVGFAWGAKRDILEKVPLYDKALIGGADHIIAHAAAGHIPHCCIQRSFTGNLDEINAWSKLFYEQVRGWIGYTKGDLYHIWHGDIDKRQYLKRVQEFTESAKSITFKDENGLYVTKDKSHIQYMNQYFKSREVNANDGFMESMAYGYLFDSTIMGGMMGGNYMGAALGNMLNDSDDRRRNDDDDHHSSINTDNQDHHHHHHYDHSDHHDHHNDSSNNSDNDNNNYTGSTFS